MYITPQKVYQNVVGDVPTKVVSINQKFSISLLDRVKGCFFLVWTGQMNVYSRKNPMSTYHCVLIVMDTVSPNRHLELS